MVPEEPTPSAGRAVETAHGQAARAHGVLRHHREPRAVARRPTRRLSHLAEMVEPPVAARPSYLGRHASSVRALPPAATSRAPLATRLANPPFEEPDAVVPHVRIRGRPGGQPPGRPDIFLFPLSFSFSASRGGGG